MAELCRDMANDSRDPSQTPASHFTEIGFLEEVQEVRARHCVDSRILYARPVNDEWRRDATRDGIRAQPSQRVSRPAHDLPPVNRHFTCCPLPIENVVEDSLLSALE